MPSRDVPELMGAAEIAEHLGVSRQRVTQLQNSAHFPPPVAKLKMGAIWLSEDIRAWARDYKPRRPGA